MVAKQTNLLFNLNSLISKWSFYGKDVYITEAAHIFYEKVHIMSNVKLPKTISNLKSSNLTLSELF